jgi:S-(hydroxymethyl)glutathione dehydrogenase/alcohol dehydrogenase
MSRQVRAALIEEIGVDGFAVEDVTLADPKAGEVRVEIEHSGACHTDWHAVEGDLPAGRYPVVGGHEGAGVVREVGPGVDDLSPGDRVVTVWVPSCGDCEMCRRGHGNLCVDRSATYASTLPDGTTRVSRNGEAVGQYLMLGTFAEEIVVPREAVVSVPEAVPSDLACILGCGVVTGFGSAAYRADIDVGDTAVVVGTGNVGLNAVYGARQSGAGRVIAVDPVERKREIAEEFGATHTVDPTAEDQGTVVESVTDGAGADVVLFTVGVGDGELIGEAYDLLGDRGELVVTATAPDDAVAVDPVDLITTEKTIKGCLYGGIDPHRAVRRLVASYRHGDYPLDALVTGHYDLDEVNRAYENLLSGADVHGVVEL